MIQLIAVHVGGSLPVVMEMETEGLNFVQRHALEHLPRSPSGVPELRSLTKADGQLQFKYKVAPEMVSPACVPELLALWDGKFTDATLKLISKKVKNERDAASAAGLWKDGVEKGDLNAMHQNCTPGESVVFQEAIDSATAKVRAKSQASKAKKAGTRAPKPKMLDSVVDATTTLDVLTGERTEKAGRLEKAVTTLHAREMVASVLANISIEGQRTELPDPLEEARLKTLSADPTEPAALATEHSQEQKQEHDAHVQHGPVGSAMPSSKDTGNIKKEVAYEKHVSTQAPRLVEMTVQDLFRHLEKGTPGVFTPQETQKISVEASQFVPSTLSFETGDPRDFGCQLDIGGDSFMNDNDDGGEAGGQSFSESCAAFYPFVEFERYSHASVLQAETSVAGATDAMSNVLSNVQTSAVTQTTGFLKSTVAPPSYDLTASPISVASADLALPSTVPVKQVSVQMIAQTNDWTSLVSFRLENHRNDARAVTLESGEVFEALGYLQICEPLSVKVEWLVDAVGEGDMVTSDVQALRAATDWLRAELSWRSDELLHWMGKTDLVSQPPNLKANSATAEKSARITNAKKRPAGWVASGCKLASLAQNISLDIAMLELTARDIARVLEGMPSWAIEAMDIMRGFAKEEEAKLPAALRSAPGAVFRDVWREELQRIDRWCLSFSNIKITRQFGLFGSTADQQLIFRLEQLIYRARTWRAAPAQASRVLAVWVAFVLSLDHENRPTSASMPSSIDAIKNDSKERSASGRQKAGGVHRTVLKPRKNLSSLKQTEFCNV